jgi:hypothetical protein
MGEVLAVHTRPPDPEWPCAGRSNPNTSEDLWDTAWQDYTPDDYRTRYAHSSRSADKRHVCCGYAFGGVVVAEGQALGW